MLSTCPTRLLSFVQNHLQDNELDTPNTGTCNAFTFLASDLQEIDS